MSGLVLKSLSGKLAAVLLGLFCAFGLLDMTASLITARLLLQEINQKVNSRLAEQITANRRLLVGGTVNHPAVKQLFDTVMAINPMTEMYLLDAEGKLLAFSAASEEIKRHVVSLDPVRRVLAGGRLPIVGDDPRQENGKKVFSVAPIPRARREGRSAPQGYLYIILGGQQFDSIVKMLRFSQILRWSVWVATASLLFSTFAGLVIVNWLTRRLRMLATVMETFRKSDFTDQSAWHVHPRADGDEIDRLGSIFVRMRERIVEQFTRLAQIDEQRRQLVANVSHDLRTPLASLQGYLETLSASTARLTGEERGYLATAIRQSQHLGDLVSELFELAQLDETPGGHLEKERFSLCELAQDVVDKLGLLFGQKHVALRAEFSPGLPMVDADIALIERVLDNLLHNALQFTSEGGLVTIACTLLDSDVVVTVSDTGRGIAAEDLPHIFDRSYRGRQEGHNVAGAGLGLTIAKKILDLHGSDLQVASRPGAGTSFVFRLPRSPEDTKLG